MNRILILCVLPFSLTILDDAKTSREIKWARDIIEDDLFHFIAPILLALLLCMYTWSLSWLLLRH